MRRVLALAFAITALTACASPANTESNAEVATLASPTASASVAVRYTTAGGSVVLGAHATEIFVRDTGLGIAPENLSRIFDRFWRADDSRSRTTGGSGLGLAIARKLAEAHGGTIDVQSRLGEGTVFIVRLPSISAHSSDDD
jgi:signal transduction histidine kinase